MIFSISLLAGTICTTVARLVDGLMVVPFESEMMREPSPISMPEKMRDDFLTGSLKVRTSWSALRSKVNWTKMGFVVSGV